MSDQTKTKEKKIAKTVTMPKSSWDILERLRIAENRSQSGQIEHLILKSSAKK